MISFRIKPLFEYFTARKILFLLWLFLLVFPKGGFKIGGIPITWGYTLLGLVSIASIFRSHFKIHIPRLQALALLVPFQAISLISFSFNGLKSIGFGFSFFLAFFLFPTTFFLLLSEQIEKLDLNRFYQLVKKGVFFVSFYGILLFFYKIGTGKLIEIPFLTINYHDMGEIISKHNDRGLIFKLISTYNNGNIYGICILIFQAFYCYLEKKTWRKYLVKSSLILTFSRTVWIGLVFNEIVYSLFVSKNKKSMLLKISIGLLFLISIFIGVATYIGLSWDFFLDRNLGGRIRQFEAIESITFFPNKPFSGISEIAYLSILDQFGILGFLSYLLALTSPIFLSIAHWKDLTPIRSSILCGLATYLFVSASDGALLLIPVMAFYWCLSTLALRKNLQSNHSDTPG